MKVEDPAVKDIRMKAKACCAFLVTLYMQSECDVDTTCFRHCYFVCDENILEDSY